MTYVGATPTTGDFKILDSITTSSATTFNLRKGGVAVYPQSANHCLVVLNGVLQTAGSSFNIVNDTIVFASSLASSDVINQILVLGNVNDIGVPSDDTVSTAKIQADAINATKIADDSISDEHLDITAITGQTAITSLADTDKFLVSDASDSGNLKYVEKQYLPSGIFNQITTVTASPSTTVQTIDNCFTSTYRNYFVTVEKLSISASDSKLEWKFRTGGSSGSDQGNNLGGASQGWLGGSNSEMTQQKVNGGAVPLTNNVYADDDFALHMWVFNPQANNERSIISGRAVYREGSTSYVGFNDFGFLSISTETHTGFKLQSTSSQFNSGGRITVYGITNP